VSTHDEKAIDEGRLDTRARDASEYIRRHGAPLEAGVVAAELCRLGCSTEEAADVVEHGLRTGTLVRLGSSFLDAGFVGGRLR
jgi:hypothetical protein